MEVGNWGKTVVSQARSFFGEHGHLFERGERVDSPQANSEPEIGAPSGARPPALDQMAASLDAFEQPTWLEAKIEVEIDGAGGVVAVRLLEPSGFRVASIATR